MLINLQKLFMFLRKCRQRVQEIKAEAMERGIREIRHKNVGSVQFSKNDTEVYVKSRGKGAEL